MRRVFSILGFLAAGMFAGCASQGVTLPALPAWQQPADTIPLSGLYVQVRARMLVPGAIVNASDSNYTPVSREWLDRYVDWTWYAAKAAHITYTPESFDCEDFTRLFDSIVGIAASRAGVKAAPLVARLVVQWDETHRHELIGVATDRGFVIVEPQPDAGPFRIWPLETYQKKILSITLGDFNP